MLCPSCGKEHTQFSVYCDNCGRELSPTSGTGPAAAPAPLFTSVSSARKSKTPLLIAVIVIVIAAATGRLALMDHETPDQRIGRLMREAAGVQQVKKAFLSRDRQFDDAFRETFRNVIKLNREYGPRLQELDTNELHKVGTAPSFADPDYAAEGLKQLHKSYELDEELEQKLAEVAGNLRRTIEETDWPASTKAAFLDGFNRGFARVMERRGRLVDADRGYVEAADNLYSYATAHHSEIQLDNGHLRIADPVVRQDFNSKIREYNARRKDLLDAKHDFEQWQSGLFKQMGVNGKDIGLK